MSAEARWAPLPEIRRLLREVAKGGPSARRLLDLAAGVARAQVVLRGAELGRRVYVGGRLIVIAEGRLVIGEQTCFFGGMLPTEILCHPGATLSIGRESGLNYGVFIEARGAVRVGDRCKIGSMVRISDSGRDGIRPVTIGDDVWLAHGAVIEPGVTLGDGSVVSAGSVVTASIPAGSLAVGNPARVVRLDTTAGAAPR
ncbi:MAG: acyltransferase [Byssovorax sp.]